LITGGSVDTSVSDLLKAAEQSELLSIGEPTSPSKDNTQQKATEQKVSTRRPGRGSHIRVLFYDILSYIQWEKSPKKTV